MRADSSRSRRRNPYTSRPEIGLADGESAAVRANSADPPGISHESTRARDFSQQFAPSGADARGSIGLDPDGPALRLCLGHFTVDVVSPAAGQLVAFIGTGVGDPAEPTSLDPGRLAVLVDAADRAETRTVWGTTAWTLATA